MAFWCSINSFNAGELSPRMIGRCDVSQYSKGCQRLENFMVTPYGAIERRPGTRFIVSAKYQTKACRLISFVFSRNVAYIIEAGEYYMRFLQGESYLKNSDGSIFELATPYSADDLAELQYVQCADIMTIVHPDHPVMELKRLTAKTFSFTEKTFYYPPMLDPNLDDELTITPSGDLAAGGSVTLSASKEIFTPEHVGGFFQLLHTRKSNEISIDFNSDGTSKALEVFGYWTFTTHGTWSGNLTIQRSYDSGVTWNDFRTYSSSKDSNTSTSGKEENENVLYRLRMRDYEASSTGTLKLCRCLLVNPDFAVHGVVKITSVNAGISAEGIVLRRIGEAAPTTEWNEGAWCRANGYPASVSYLEERMFFGGTKRNPQTVWGSKTNAWDNYLIGKRDDDALQFTLASDTVNDIAWMTQHNALIIGTMDSEWTLSGVNAESAITPTAFRIKRQSVYGSSGVVGRMVGETLLFVQRGSRKVREFVYSWEKDGYAAVDVTILANHVTRSGIVETALQQLPDNIFWCLLADGTLSALTYEREQEVVGWQRCITNGKVCSVAVIPDGDQDRVYLAVERNNAFVLEIMAPRNMDEACSRLYLDSAVEKSGSALTEINGLDHLENMTVKVIADGAEAADAVVHNGAITLDIASDHVIVGLDYISIVQPMPLEIDTQNGSSMLRKKLIGELRVRFYDTVGGEIKVGSGDFVKLVSRDVLADDLDEAVEVKTETLTVNSLAGYDYDSSIIIRQSGGLPMNLTSLTVNYRLME